MVTHNHNSVRERVSGPGCGGSDPGGVGEDALRWLTALLGDVGLADRELLEPLATELIRRGCRPRKAWRLANRLNQNQVAEEFNRISTDNGTKTDGGMKAPRISEFESWPELSPTGKRRARPTVRSLTILATIYNTTWDRLVDIDDLKELSTADQAAYRAAVKQSRSGLATRSAIALLPSEGVPFVGRKAAMAELRGAIDDHSRGERGTLVITGLAGVGKTTIARQAVQEFADRFPDGVVWLDLHGHDRECVPRRAEHALEQLLVELDVKPATIPGGQARYAERWRWEAGRRRMLIVLDNALDSRQVRPLLPQSAGCFVVVTSRRPLTGLVGVRRLHLEPMELAEAEELLVTLGNLGPGYDTDAVHRILRTSGGLPLPIRLLAGQLAHHGPGMLTAIAGDFASQAERLAGHLATDPAGSGAANRILDQFAAEDESVRAALDLSYRELPDEAAQRTLRLLGWFPGSAISAETLAAMLDPEWNMPDPAVQLRQLFEGGWLDPVTGRPGRLRYRIHDLSRLYARSLADALGTSAEHAAVIGRLLRHYLGEALEIEPPQPARPFGANKGLPPQRQPSRRPAVARARDWLVDEHDSLLACIRIAALDADTAALALLVGTQLSALGYWADAREMFELAHLINTNLDDRVGAGDAMYGLANVLRSVCDYAGAARWFESALDIATEIGDSARVASILGYHAEVCRHQGLFDIALAESLQVLELARALGDPLLECDALRNYGHLERIEKRSESSHRLYIQALGMALQIGDRYGEGWALWGLAILDREQEMFAAAWEKLERARTIATELHDTWLEVDTIRGMGHIHRERGEHASAHLRYSDSLTLAEQTDDSHGQADAWRALGHLALLTNDAEHARECLSKALAMYEPIDVMLFDEVQRELHEFGMDAPGSVASPAGRRPDEQSLTVA
ncbi:tetratricopeptide repeat protein [Nocardia sp. ET3-3]|uniref:Tetratricopeptide repeat protein n=1 Tax=Nocardia terrae TaxID=2675851 RepID=A0A7K1VBS1_9NOCA|nr:tetratricopeptide repeat protein [Nocardia terrae]MVU83548.1 tetratricopeptide repeat protein [Nocardia terrae]